MTRILIDCTLIDFSRQPTGIPRVVLRYIEEAYDWAKDTDNEVIPVVPTDSGLWMCRPVPGANAPTKLLEIAERSERKTRSRAHDVDPFPHLVKPGKGDILFAPAYWHDVNPQIYIDIKNSGCKIAILIHDILPIVYKQFYQAPWRYQFSAAVTQAIMYADHLFCVSNVTKLDVEAFATAQNKTLPPITVAYNGYQSLVEPRVAGLFEQNLLGLNTDDPLALQAFASDRPLLMVGSIEPKKGHIPVIKSLEAMWMAGYSRNLVIVGRGGWMEREIIDYITGSPFYGVKLFWLSGLDDHDLAYAYIKSHALVFASLGEGFGLPMIEAACFGKPVICLSTPITKEILGDCGSYFKESSDLVETIIDLEDSSTYEKITEKLKGYHWPTWDLCTQQVISQLGRLVKDLDFATK